MKNFLDDDFLLQSESAIRLYHEYAKDQPIIDYHNHLPPQEIVQNRVFKNITQAWLEGDHYKWRAMRSNGVDEKYCTGNATDKEKFIKWSETVPYTMRNPLYHWTHLELQRYFDIKHSLNPSTAEAIYKESSQQLQSLGTNLLLQNMKVEVVCSTDDPLDDLSAHRQWQEEDHEMKLLPTFRADKVLFVHDNQEWNSYLNRLSEVAGIDIQSYDALLEALKNRHDYFHAQGCRLSDNGIEYFPNRSYSVDEIKKAFRKARDGKSLKPKAIEKFQTAVLVELARMNHGRGWTQQYHIGALRNTNSRMMDLLGRDAGFDSIGDFSQAGGLARFLNHLDSTDQLAQTIIYNLNPSDNAVIATMIGNFNDGSIAGKVQFGSGWWYLDQKDGIEQQLNTLSNMGLLSRFVGMLTDSRSFLSFPRHEYFRRVLCNVLGNDIEKGELPNDLKWIGQLVQDISYNNAKNYFKFEN